MTKVWVTLSAGMRGLAVSHAAAWQPHFQHHPNVSHKSMSISALSRSQILPICSVMEGFRLKIGFDDTTHSSSDARSGFIIHSRGHSDGDVLLDAVVQSQRVEVSVTFSAGVRVVVLAA